MSGGGGEDGDARFARILGAFGPSLDRLAAAYEADPAERDDLLQDISFALWRALPSFRGECSERTFVYRIAHNRGLTHRARRKVRATEPLESADVVPDSRPDPERALITTLSREQLQAAVRRLPEGARQVVTLSLSGLTAAEIGEVLGITENNAAVRLSRARRALKDLL
jgi:RNA polymerase sigma-70 factor (ECF subfamily)